MSDLTVSRHAAEALSQLQSDGEGRLVWQIWPEEDLVVGPSIADPDPDDWGEPVLGEPYLALSRS